MTVLLDALAETASSQVRISLQFNANTISSLSSFGAMVVFG